LEKYWKFSGKLSTEIFQNFSENYEIFQPHITNPSMAREWGNKNDKGRDLGKGKGDHKMGTIRHTEIPSRSTLDSIFCFFYIIFFC